MTDINIDGVITWLNNWFQEKLVSGTNIKTINNQSLLGSGNISISGGGGDIEDTGWKNVTFNSGYINYDANNPLQYRRYGKIVEVRGIVKVSSAKSGTSHTIANISDTTCRPSRAVRFYQTGGANYHCISTIDSSGSIILDRLYSGNTSQSSWSTSMFFIIEGMYLAE